MRGGDDFTEAVFNLARHWRVGLKRKRDPSVMFDSVRVDERMDPIDDPAFVLAKLVQSTSLTAKL